MTSSTSSSERPRVKNLLHRLVVAAVVGLVVAALSVAGAGAAPINAPSHASGTFSCSDGSSGTFVNNQGTNHDPKQAWVPGFVTFSDGATAVFVPTSIVVTVGGTVVFRQDKGNSSGDVTCTIPMPGGTTDVTGNFVAG